MQCVLNSKGNKVKDPVKAVINNIEKVHYSLIYHVTAQDKQ